MLSSKLKSVNIFRAVFFTSVLNLSRFGDVQFKVHESNVPSIARIVEFYLLLLVGNGSVMFVVLFIINVTYVMYFSCL